MKKLNVEDILRRNIDILSTPDLKEMEMTPSGDCPLPSISELEIFINNIRTVIFPEFFDRRRNYRLLRPAIVGVRLEKIYSILSEEIIKAMQLNVRTSCRDVNVKAARLAMEFIDCLPEIKRQLYTDVQAVFDNDPATDDYSEIVLSYPVVWAMIHYRVAHALLKMEVPLLPRIITEQAHSKTGIDINPGASIGDYFAIDHGTGVVIGQTCIIGNHVTVYQGVTLGARNFAYDEGGLPVNIPRHPIIEDNVTIYSNASILGRITVGHDSIIGGNVWLTKSVEPYSKVLQHESTKAHTNG